MDLNMKTKKPNAELVWKQVDDELVPRLRLRVADRAAYCYLLRHSRLEGKLRLGFSVPWLARGIGLSSAAARRAVRRLVEHKALRLVECSTAGRVVDVRLPEEILADYPEGGPRPLTSGARAVRLEEEDFLRTKRLRQAIHAREGGRCFYCLRQLTTGMKCIDHVVPQALLGRNGYRNLVSCCRDCNSQKGTCRADDFLRSLFRERQLTAAELAARLRALDALASGNLKPEIGSEGGKQVRR